MLSRLGIFQSLDHVSLGAVVGVVNVAGYTLLATHSSMKELAIGSALSIGALAFAVKVNSVDFHLGMMVGPATVGLTYASIMFLMSLQWEKKFALGSAARDGLQLTYWLAPPMLWTASIHGLILLVKSYVRR